MTNTATSIANFRLGLKDYLDKAANEPVRLNRRDESFILMNEAHYIEMKNEIDNLQRQLIGALDIVKENFVEVNSREERLEKLKKNR